MKIEVNFGKGFLIFVAAVFILIGAIAVYASSGSNPSTFGHTADQISGVVKSVDVPNCGSGKALTKNSSGWSCASFSSEDPVNGSVVGGAMGTTTAYYEVSAGTWKVWGNFNPSNPDNPILPTNKRFRIPCKMDGESPYYLWGRASCAKASYISGSPYVFMCAGDSEVRVLSLSSGYSFLGCVKL